MSKYLVPLVGLKCLDVERSVMLMLHGVVIDYVIDICGVS